MDAGDYLDQLRCQLKGFLPEQQEQILAEIASHLEEGEQDETRGHEAAGRRERVLSEMGSPGDMSAGFRAVYRPNRWLDFVLIFIPAYLLYPAIDVLYLWVNHQGTSILDDAHFYAFTLRAVILLGLVMTLVAVRRRSLLLFAFWVPDVITRLVTLMTREGRWLPRGNPGASALLEMLLGYALLLVLTFWLARTLWRNRENLLIVLFALQPVIGSLFGYITTSYSLAHGISPDYPNWRILGFGVVNLLEMTSLAGFILLRPRDLRWAAFLLGMGNYTALMVSAYWPNPLPVSIWMAYTFILVLIWSIDRRRRISLAV